MWSEIAPDQYHNIAVEGYNVVAYQFGDGSLYAWELDQDGKKITHRPQGQWAFACLLYTSPSPRD